MENSSLLYLMPGHLGHIPCEKSAMQKTVLEMFHAIAFSGSPELCVPGNDGVEKIVALKGQNWRSNNAANRAVVALRASPPLPSSDPSLTHTNV